MESKEAVKGKRGLRGCGKSCQEEKADRTLAMKKVGRDMKAGLLGKGGS